MYPGVCLVVIIFFVVNAYDPKRTSNDRQKTNSEDMFIIAMLYFICYIAPYLAYS